MNELLYPLLITVNNMNGAEYFNKLSKAEKIGIFSSLALGLDAIVTPVMTKGKTLHQIVLEVTGMPINEAAEYWVRVAESGLAYLAQLYHAFRNLQICSKDTIDVKEEKNA